MSDEESKKPQPEPKPKLKPELQHERRVEKRAGRDVDLSESGETKAWVGWDPEASTAKPKPSSGDNE